MLIMYPAIIHDDEDGYWIEFPDLPGCNSVGDTLAELMLNASEALGAYVAYLMDEGQSVPEASTLESIACEDAETTYVYTDLNKYRRDTKAVKKMLSIPAWLAKEAELRNYSLSKVLQEALLEKMNLA